MAPTLLSCLGLLLLVSLLGLIDLPATRAEYPGVIELVGYSNRRARTHFMPVASGRQLESATLAPPAAKMQADMETVRQNIEKYNKLLTLDTKNLPESQKDMLERIVERVARLKETLEDNAENRTSTPLSSEDSALSTAATTEASTVVNAETDPTLVLDETTLLQLQTSMNELAAAQAAVTAQTTSMREPPTTTEFSLDAASAADSTMAVSAETTAEMAADTTDIVSTTLDPLDDATDADDQFVAARSNNIGITAADADSSATLTTMAGSQRTLTTSGKLSKTRATKRPSSSSTKASGAATIASKRGQRPAQAATTAGLHKQTTIKQKLPATASITTIQPLQYQKLPLKPQLQLPSYQHKVSLATAASPATAATPAEKRTPPQVGTPTSGSSPTANYGNSNNSPSNNNSNDLVYDAHVNTSAIIDSLNQAREEFYQQKLTVNQKDKKPSATAKPTKYHYYPHNQHIYLLPECAIQQVCNAVYVRLNYTQPLCACPSRYRDPCSASLNEDDQHTTKLIGDGKKKAITLAKTCEATTEMRECRSPKDWSLLALQNTRTGKSHYLVICRCPDHFKMEGPMAHDQPTYASVPGIRVFGMMCVKPGYSVRKPSVQPPKRYQLQKPFYRPGSQSSYVNNNQYGGGSSSSNKDTYGRPTYGSSAGSSDNYQPQSTYQSQQQSNYQYLNRPESSHSTLSINNHNNNYRPDTLTSINNFPSSSIYGRNNERKGDVPIEAATEEEGSKLLVSTSTQPTEETQTTLTSDEKSAFDSAAETTAAAAPASEEESKRERRSLITEDANDLESDDVPEFPWDRVIEFQQSIVWD